MCIININIYHVHMGLCRKVEKWFDGLNFGFSHLHDYLGLHDYPGLKSKSILLLLKSSVRVRFKFDYKSSSSSSVRKNPKVRVRLITRLKRYLPDCAT